MADRASSDHLAVQAQLDRLASLSPGSDILGLERITRLLDRLGNPQERLPPLLHVAGTNGKGSTCAFLRSTVESAGLKAHVYTSPHLVRFNERIRLAGELITDEALAGFLAEVLDRADGMEISFFEATTAAAFVAFSRIQADICIVEVGLGGRLDATNVIKSPLVCGIASLGLDHSAFLGTKLDQIAWEKAGIAKPGIPLITQHYPPVIAQRVRSAAALAGASWIPRGETWDVETLSDRLRYQDRKGVLELPVPALSGTYQHLNAGLAIAMLRHQHQFSIPEGAFAAAMRLADWPARLQKLAPGPIVNPLPEDSELWLDGGHNPAAARAVADHFLNACADPKDFHIILGLLANKDQAGVLEPFARLSPTFHMVPVPGHEHHPPSSLAATARSFGLEARIATDVKSALAGIESRSEGTPRILIMGSLYLAGEVLRMNDQIPA